MAEAGVLEPDARVELIDGEVIDMAPLGSRHYAAVSRLHRLLSRSVGDRAIVNARLPLRLGTASEPVPDVSVLKLRADDYGNALPTAADALLVIEVSDSTLPLDLRTKARLYATHGVQHYWVIDLPNALLHVHTQAAGQVYGRITSLHRPGEMPVPGVDGAVIDMAAIFGAA